MGKVASRNTVGTVSTCAVNHHTRISILSRLELLLQFKPGAGEAIPHFPTTPNLWLRLVIEQCVVFDRPRSCAQNVFSLRHADVI
ncbi:hypothetical protein OPQ81_003020 [Rhizoctonia solani]|nr:hypothetical protein OPQ81_003020 [Rhizoctonia solani]